jgi:CIC family chloride channel protein
MKRFFSWRLPGTWGLFRADDRLLLIVTGMVVGMAGGFAAYLLNRGLIILFDFLHPFRTHAWSFVLPGVGAALSVLFLTRVVCEKGGHGVPEVIYSVSRLGGKLKDSAMFSRLVASCLTIGSGGSAGPESPVVISGAAIGSNIARFFSMNERQRVTLLGCGAAGAISSIFNAPIAGLVFVLEVVLGEWSKVHIVPVAVASVAGTQLSRLLSGNQIAFSHSGFPVSYHDTLACVGLALFTAFISVTMTRSIRTMNLLAGGTQLPAWVKAAVGGCAVGLIGLAVPDVLGEGYHSIREMIEGVYAQGVGLVLMACFVKVLATSFTLGWGGSGGIFAPSLVVGSFAGLAYHRMLVFLFPTLGWMGEGGYALIGMAGLVGGILQAPLTGIFLIVEITGGYEVILPLIIVSSISATVCYYFEPASLYMKELVEKGHLLRPGTDGRVLSDLSVQELIERDCTVVRPDMTLRDLATVITHSRRNHYPVEDPESGKFIGMVTFDDIRPYLFETIMYDAVFVDQIMNGDVTVCHPGDDVADVLNVMGNLNLYSMPVVDDGFFVGMVSKATLFDHYRKELMVQTDQNGL